MRPADANDLPAIARIVAAAFAPHAARIGRRPAPMDADYASLIAARWVHVAEDDGAVLGLVVLIPEPDGLLLDTVAVSPAAQGHGVGRRLLAFAEDLARAARLPAIRLYTNAAMTGNLVLYGRLGYIETGRGVEDGFHRVHMRKALS